MNQTSLTIEGKILGFKMGALVLKSADDFEYRLDVIDPGRSREWCQKRVGKRVKVKIVIEEYEKSIDKAENNGNSLD